MNKKTKNLIKVGVVALAILLCLSLAIGLTGAWYKASRTASGTLALNQGIIIDYQGFGKDTSDIWQKEETTTFKLFSDVSAVPGTEISLNEAKIKANTDSVDFYARVKLDYELLDAANQPVTGVEASQIFKPANLFAGEWVDGGAGDGYFYYGHDTTLDVFTKTNTEYTSIFATGAKLVVDENLEGEGPGITIDGKTISTINISLTLETLQGSATSEQAASLGWEISLPPVIEDFSVNYLADRDGNKIYTLNEGQKIELVEDTGYKTIAPNGTWYAFAYKLNEGKKEIKILGCEKDDSLEKVEIPDYIRINNENYKVTEIGDYAFAEVNITDYLSIPSSVTKIGMSSITGFSINSIKVASGNSKYYLSEDKNCLLERTSEDVVTLKIFIPSELTEYVIPEDVTIIDHYAFAAFKNLQSITIPEKVTQLGALSFYNCSGLRTITIKAKTPPTMGTEAFGGDVGTIYVPVIYVPDASVEAYKTAASWSQYAEKIKPISEKPTV